MPGRPHLLLYNETSGYSNVDKGCGLNPLATQATDTKNATVIFFVCQTGTFLFVSDIPSLTQATDSTAVISSASTITKTTYTDILCVATVTVFMPILLDRKWKCWSQR